MHRAACACADKICTVLKTRKDSTDGRVVILCGSGNNGGDGILCAKLLCEDGIPAVIVPAFADGDTRSPECAIRWDEARRFGVPVLTPDEFLRGEETNIRMIVDALFGIGLSREPEGIYADLIDAANGYAAKHAIPTAAIDIASGIFADTGRVSAHTFRASLTLAVNNAKRGHLFYPGASYTGQLHILDIDIPETPLETADRLPVHMLTDDDVRTMLPARMPDSNKGTNGRILIAAGSMNMCGAAYLSALAAYRCGAGLVEIFTDDANRIPLQTLLPEAILTTYDPHDTDTACARLCASVKRASAIVIGPGLSTSDTAAALVHTVLKHTSVPTVLDADALNVLAAEPSWIALGIRTSAAPLILTPHPGELSRLTGKPIADLLGDPVGCAVGYAAEHHLILNAKDTRSVITDGARAYINPTGTSALAKGGSGDVLTGITATLAAQECSPLNAAALAAYLHGRAAEVITARMGTRSPLASEIADALGEVFMTLERSV